MRLFTQTPPPLLLPYNFGLISLVEICDDCPRIQADRRLFSDGPGLVFRSDRFLPLQHRRQRRQPVCD